MGAWKELPCTVVYCTINCNVQSVSPHVIFKISIHPCYIRVIFSRPFSSVMCNDMMPVDLYIGGKEHAHLHLYYARFIMQYLADQGMVQHRSTIPYIITYNCWPHAVVRRNKILPQLLKFN